MGWVVKILIQHAGRIFQLSLVFTQNEFNAGLEISSRAELTPMKQRRILGGNKTLELYLPLFPLGSAASSSPRPSLGWQSLLLLCKPTRHTLSKSQHCYRKGCQSQYSPPRITGKRTALHLAFKLAEISAK